MSRLEQKVKIYGIYVYLFTPLSLKALNEVLWMQMGITLTTWFGLSFSQSVCLVFNVSADTSLSLVSLRCYYVSAPLALCSPPF